MLSISYSELWFYNNYRVRGAGKCEHRLKGKGPKASDGFRNAWRPTAAAGTQPPHSMGLSGGLGVVLVAQSCPTLRDPVDCSPPGSSVHVILQARILEWVAILFSRGFSRPRDRTCISYVTGRFFTVWATGEAGVPSLASSEGDHWEAYLRSILNYLCMCVCVYTFEVCQSIIISLFDAHSSIFGQ